MKAGLDVVGLPFVDATGQRVGRVHNLVLDDRKRHVLGVILERGWLRRRRQFVALDNVSAIRRDRVIASAAPSVTGAPEAATGSLAGKLVVSRVGRYLGVVDDIYFDERTGEVHAYEVVQPEPGSGRRRRTIIRADACPAIADVMVVPDRTA